MGSGANRLFVMITAILMISAIGLPLSSSFAQEEQDSPLFSPDSEPYGLSYGEQTAEWWKWFLSIPIGENPIDDQTGERCAEQQSGSVWFLVGSGGGKAERSCTIPAGKAILIPAINVECSTAEDESLNTEALLRDCANSDQDLVTQTSATLDGSDLQVHRVESPLFEFTFPPDNVFAAPEGHTQAVSDGFWVYLKPLPPGNHELHVMGILVDPTVTGPVNLVEDSTYHLTVEASSFTVYAEAVAFADKSFDFPINSTSTVSDLEFDEQTRQLSFTLSGEAEGTTTLPISWLLEGPYTVMINGEETDYESSENPETGETTLTFAQSEGTHNAVVIGTSVSPEFPYAVFILLVAIAATIILGRTRLVNNGKFRRDNSF